MTHCRIPSAYRRMQRSNNIITCKLWLWVLLVVLLGGSGVKVSATNKMHIGNTSGSVKIDGRLSDGEWQGASKTQLSFVTFPYENTRPPVETLALVMADEENLYIAFDAQDPHPGQISASYRERDQAWVDDLVGVRLDTFGDGRLAYEFFVNPLGVQIDAIANEMAQSESTSWDAIWAASGTITENGFVVEMAIPFAILSFADEQESQTWGLELLRFYPREHRYRIAHVMFDRNIECELCQFGKLGGIQHKTSGHHLNLVPSFVWGRSEQRIVQPSLPWQSQADTIESLDLKWHADTDLILQGTLNPDFSQVEADAAQLSINNPFTLFFEEKRPFFQENADFFTSNFNLIYSRTINAPDWGAKATGRINNHSFGLFNVQDETTTLVVPGNLGSQITVLDEQSNNTAFRYRYDQGQFLSLGWVTTLRRASEYENQLHAADVTWRSSPTDIWHLQIARSSTRYPDQFFTAFCFTQNCDEVIEQTCEFGRCPFSEAAVRTFDQGRFSGLAYRLAYNHIERDWWFNFNHTNLKSGFRADLGFQDRVDNGQSLLGGGWHWYNQTGWWSQISVFADWDITHNDEGELLEKEWEGGIEINARNQSSFTFHMGTRDRTGPRLDQSRIAIDANSKRFRQEFFTLDYNTRPSPELGLGINVQWGDEVDFANNRNAQFRQWQPSITWDPNQHWQLSARAIHKQVDADGANLFDVTQWDLRFSYQHNIQSRLRLSVIYTDVSQEPDNYLFFQVNERSKTLSTQLLFSHEINPFTLLYLGYSDNYIQNDNLGSLKQNQRSYFAKVSYAFTL